MRHQERSIHDGSDSTGAAASRWSDPPSAKQRAAVQRAVSTLLDDLAPEPALSRGERPVRGLQRHRSPRGCILQAATAAVTVSWFPEASTDAAIGELHIVVWRGVVSRPGSAQRTEGAVTVREIVLWPTEVAPNTWGWRAADSTVYDAVALAERCHAFLESQISDSAVPDGGVPGIAD